MAMMLWINSDVPANLVLFSSSAQFAAIFEITNVVSTILDHWCSTAQHGTAQHSTARPGRVAEAKESGAGAFEMLTVSPVCSVVGSTLKSLVVEDLMQLSEPSVC